MRVSGLISSVDWENVVDQLMQLESRPLSLLQAQRSKLENLSDIWSKATTLLGDIDKAAGALADAALFSRFSVTSSHAERVTATASAAAVPGEYQVVVKQLAQAHAVTSAKIEGAVGDSGTLELSGNGGTEWVSVEVTDTDTVVSLAQKINQAFEQKRAEESDFVGVRATVIDNRLVLTRSATGSVEIQMRDGNTDLLENLGFTVPGTDDQEFTAESQLRPAQAAQVTINGIAVESEANSVTAVPGMTIDLLQADPGVTVTLTVALDRKAVEQEVQAFVSAYNKLLDSMAGWTGRGQPLQGDATARALVHTLRQRLGDAFTVDGKTVTLAEIGLKAQDQSGRLTFDAQAFWKVYEADPEGVKGALSAAFGAVDAYLEPYVDRGGFLERKRDGLSDRIDDIDESISRMEQRLALRRENLLARFVQMERLLSQLTTQESWLTAQVQNLQGAFRRS